MLKDPRCTNTTHFKWSSKRKRILMNHPSSMLNDSTRDERVNHWMSWHLNGWIENNCVLESETMMLIGRPNKSERIRSSTLCLQESFRTTITLHGLTSLFSFVRGSMNSHVDQWIENGGIGSKVFQKTCGRQESRLGTIGMERTRRSKWNDLIVVPCFYHSFLGSNFIRNDS